MNLWKFLTFVCAWLCITAVHATSAVTVSGMEKAELDAYYEGAAKVIEASGKIQFLKQGSGVNAWPMFLIGNAVSPISSMVELPQTRNTYEQYQKGAADAAQFYSQGLLDICIPPRVRLTRSNVEEAINEKFTGSFQQEHMSVLMFGALEAFQDEFRCKTYGK